MNKFLIFSSAALLSFHYADAVNRYWSLDGTGAWNDAANWGGTVPTSSDTVYINNGGTATIPSGVAGSAGTNFYIGYAAGDSGNLIIEDGGSFKNTQTYLGGYVSGAGTASGNLTLNGSASFTTSGAFVAGYYGSSILTLNGASSLTTGTVATNYSRLGYYAGSSGTVYLNDSATWNASGTFIIGDKGAGSIVAGGTSQITAGSFVYIANSPGSSGTVLLKDSATFTATNTAQSFNIAGVNGTDGGTASFTLQNEAQANIANAVYIGNGGVGSLSVKDSSTFTADMISIYGTQSSMLIEGGTVYTTRSGASTANGITQSTVNITNGGKWVSTNAIGIGSGAAFTIEGEGSSFSSTASSNNTVANGGVVNVNDGGSWTVSSGTQIGGASTTFNVSGGGKVSSGDDIIYGGGTVSLKDTASWTSSSDLVVGYSSGSSSMILDGSATLSASGLYVGYSTGASAASGNLVIKSDGVKIVGSDGTAPLAITGTDGSGYATGFVKFQHDGTLVFANLMTGANLAFEHSGAGKTTVGGSNTYGAGTVISNGTVVAANSSAFGTGAVKIAGGTLALSVDSVNLNNFSIESGTLALADGAAQTINVSDFSMTGGTMAIDILSGDSFDKVISSSGTMSYGDGTVMLTGYENFEGNISDGVGNRYKIFDGFSTISGDSWTIEGYDDANWTANIDADGYLYFDVVPEPSTYAAIFGALALGLAACRRKK